MRILDDGSSVTIHRTGNGFSVEHIGANGTLIDAIDCVDFLEARAAFAFGPARW